MKVVFLLPGWAWKPVGGYRVVYAYASRLAARGHEVTVVHARRLPRGSIPPAPDLATRLRRAADFLRNLVLRPRVDWEPIHPAVRMRYAPGLAPRHVPDADAVIATWWATAEIALGYPPAKGRRCYLIQSYEDWGGPRERVDATWRAPLDKVVVSEWLREKGIELGVPASELTHIPNGLDHGRWRLERPVEGRPPRVALLYSASPTKGFADALAALEAARAELPALEAVVFGTEPPPALPAWARYLHDPPQDVLARDVYNACSVALAASWAEGWHLPSAEAMACGCAVVSTDNGGIRDFAVHGETALLSRPREPDALAANLLRVLRDDGLRIRLAHAGRRRIGEFTWERSADRLERWLQERIAS